MSTNSTILSMQHTVRIQNLNRAYKMDALFSLKFSHLYLSGAFPGLWKLYILQLAITITRKWKLVGEN